MSPQKKILGVLPVAVPLEFLGVLVQYCVLASFESFGETFENWPGSANQYSPPEFYSDARRTVSSLRFYNCLEVASEFSVFLSNFHAGSPGPAWKKGVDLEFLVHPQLLCKNIFLQRVTLQSSNITTNNG